MTTRPTGLSAPGPAAAGHAAQVSRTATRAPGHVAHGLVIVERDLHWTPVTFGEIAARF